MTLARVYCTSCGAAAVTGAQHCVECGARLPRDVLVAESAGDPAAPDPAAGTSGSKRLLVGGVAAAAVLVTAGVTWGFSARSPEPAAGARPTAEAGVPSRSAAPTPATQETMAATVTGKFDGSMHSQTGNTYDFTLRLTEHSDGTIDARMRQTERDSGAAGLEILTGQRNGSVVTLNGQYWEYSPQGWETDQIRLRFGAGLDRFRGDYRCASCAGRLQGSRV